MQLFALNLWLTTYLKGRPSTRKTAVRSRISLLRSACTALCILPAESPLLFRESSDTGKCFLHLWMQLCDAGCIVPNTGFLYQFELYSALFFFCFLLGNISLNLSVGFLAVIFLKQVDISWPEKHGNVSFSEQLETVPPNPCLQVFFSHPAEHRKCDSHDQRWTQLRCRLGNTHSLS